MAFGILSLLCAARARRPNLSVTQLLKIAANTAGWKDDDLYWCPDETLEVGLEMMLDE